MINNKVSDSVYYVGADDKTLDLFESQYDIPDGVSYNSYIVMDEKIAVIDTVDDRVTDEWFNNIDNVLQDKTPDYLIVSHLEPDHSDNIIRFMNKYKTAVMVSNAKVFAMLPQFFSSDELKGIEPERRLVVSDQDILNLGEHTFTFVMAPMVHWPEVMVEYESTEKILFSADGFGRFGALNGQLFEKQIMDWDDEARRYYINIVGKYGVNVQALLKKAADLDINIICPLHGRILNDNLSEYIKKYNLWSSYTPEDKGVLIAYASIHGNTQRAAEKLMEILLEKGEGNVVVCDLSRVDMAEAVALAFRYDRMVLAGITYDAALMPCMEDFLYHIKVKNYQNRTVGVIENGSWGITAAKQIVEQLEKMKNITICNTKISIKTTLSDENIQAMYILADELIK